MADPYEVQNILVALAASVLYPNGTAQPSICGVPIKIYAGHPLAASLDQDIADGSIHVSVYTRKKEVNVTRHIGDEWQVIKPGEVTLSPVVSGNSLTLSGTVSVPQNLFVQVDTHTYTYSVQPTDTLTSIATALGALIQADFADVTTSGAVVSVPSAYVMTARAGAVGSAVKELRRQLKQFKFTVWAPNSLLRSTVCSALDIAMSSSTDMVFSDGAHGIVQYVRSREYDLLTNTPPIYQRILMYTVDYPTTMSVVAPQVITPVLNVASAS